MEDGAENSCSNQMGLEMGESSRPWVEEPGSEVKCLQADDSEKEVLRLEMEEKSAVVVMHLKEDAGFGSEPRLVEIGLQDAASGNELSLQREEKLSESEVVNFKEAEGSESEHRSHVGVLQQDGSMCEVAVLQMEVVKLQEKLKACEDELQKVQKQLSLSERMQKSTESYNQDLRLQVEKLSRELHDRKKKEKNRVEAETQTEEYTWTETDYYNYYYGGYYQTAAEATAETEGTVSTEMQETTEPSETCTMATETTVANQQQAKEMNNVANTEETEVGDSSSSIADMLRATAEEAVSQTGFVFDESSGLYYDHATGFYYDSSSQLYYDASTGMYYYYDPESGKYQFHSRIELPTSQSTDQPEWVDKNQEKINKKKNKKTSEKAAHLEIKDHCDLGTGPDAVKCRKDCSKVKGDEMRRDGEKTKKREKAKNGRRSRSRTSKSSDRADGSGGNRRRRCSRSHSDDKQKIKKNRKKKKRRRRSGMRDESGESEPEEGEITGSEGEKEPSSSSSSPPPSASSSPAPQSPVIETQAQEEAWPPCVRVTVVRSPVLQTGTLFILTADTIATIGREKDMDHAIRIPEMGVSKSHAEVYFDHDQQCYMLVDHGSQNGTVVNGNRILQPKVRCDPCPLTHGDEVKLGETVLSFHIHSGTDTCDGCEPGQVRAHLSRHRQDDSSVCVLSKEDKELQRQKELKQIKIKYGLKNSDYEDSSVFKNCQYKDRAESRRQTVGSEGNFHRDDAPASLHTEISEENKGRQMLEKMGWKSGDGLGKDSAGIKEPIGLLVRPAQSGLGSVLVLSAEDISGNRSKNQQNWERARERFSQTQTPKASQAWVKGQPSE